MIKIRLHGTKEEVDNAASFIRGTFRVLSESNDYCDRGKSIYVRRYIDAETYTDNIKQLIEKEGKLWLED